MDPVQVILAALNAGRSASDPAAARAYSELKVLILNTFADNARAIRALEDYGEDPETYERPLAKALREAGADQSGELLAAAGRLLQRDDPQHFDVLRQIAERETIRTSDRFTRMAEGVPGLKAQAEAASRERMEQYWSEEFKRSRELAERQARQQQQERRMLIGVVTIAIIIVLVFIAIAIISRAA